MAWFSFHGGHSGEFCRHAQGTLETILETAVERGFTTYGVSEHAPKQRARDLQSDEQDLTPEDTQATFRAYAGRALELREAFAGRLEVLVGFETETVPPDCFADSMRALRSQAPFDYVVGSVHHVGDWPIDVSVELFEEAARDLGGRDALDCAYFDQVAEMATALRPQVVGHLDLIRLCQGQNPSFAPSTWPHIERALEAVSAAGSLLDINAAPLRKNAGPVYPIPPILERAREMDIPVTLGDDSHGPDHVGLNLGASVRAIAAAGYREIHCLRRVDGAVRPEPVPIAEVAP